MKRNIGIIIILLFGFSLKAQKTISSILINGNNKTKKEIILRELELKTDSAYSQDELKVKILKSKNNLTNLKLFNFVDIKSIEKSQDIEIQINVIEKWYIWPYPIFELSDRNFNTWWEEFSENNYSDFSRINYGVFFNWENFRGRNELLKLKIRKGFKEHFLISFQAPFINKNKTLGFGVDLNLFRRKKTFYKTINNELIFYENQEEFTSKDYSIELNANYRKGIYNKHNFNISYYNTLISDSIRIKNYKYLNNNKTSGSFIRSAYTFISEHRDYVIYPLKGHYLSIEIAKHNALKSPVNHLEAIGKFEKHLALKENIFLGSSFNLRLTSKEEQPYFSQKGFGFQQYVRGYEYYVIDGQSYWLSRTALKYELVKKYKFDIPYIKMSQFKQSHHSIYIGIFSDMGYIFDEYNSSTNPLQKKLLWGKGIALDYITYYDQILRIEYSLNHLGEKGVFLHFSNPFG